ncbi:DNA (cytosine-5)-methyltransferase 1 [Colletotrichum fructicola Nara gc5]|uniref:DNA (cytosine-5-)-methyltransferase n=1 Tax=Colletotrichum fructicola (strain Nara gc5) TaxID=1213859 RepID=A0A7J6J4D5_COLFN|nr:DNA (cytosine-5)-methyltransferase 1 [Colletotrichum fructicola Nara gc5]
MPGPIEDYEDELGNLLVADYDEGQDWEAADNLAKIENREILRVLENPAVANPSDDAPVLREFRGDAQIVFLPPDFQPVTNISVDLPPSTLISPRYLYQGQELPAPVDREFRVVQNLLEEHRRTSEGGDDFIDFELDQFTVYTEPYMGGLTEAYEKMRYPAEMRPLQHLSIKPGCTVMYVDGVLSIGDARYFVRQVPFEELPIGNYGLSESTIGREIWIRSKMNTKAADRGKEDVYYRLKNPSPEYRRFHMGFIWVANLGKHVADYLCAALPGNDFRTAIVANLDFIYKEVYGLLGWHKTKSIYMWKEIRDYTAYPDTSKKTPSTPTSGASSPAPGKAAQIDKTIVTPYTYQLFNHLPCGMMMEAMAPSPRAEKLRTDLISAYKLEPSPSPHAAAHQVHKKVTRGVCVGDVISTTRDDDGSHWAREVAAGFDDVDRWFGLVQKVHKLRDEKRCFDVIWLYRPVDTLCGPMKYPWNNELFLSDHCSCGDGYPKIKESEVLSIHHVHWGGAADTDAEFFCRQTYLTKPTIRRWITFQQSHLRCNHQIEAFAHKVGDSLLISPENPDDLAEPYELVSGPDEENMVVLRRLSFFDVCRSSTNETTSIDADRIHGRCLVRFFRRDEPLLPPYGRNGVGNAFFVTHHVDSSGQIVRMDDAPPTLRQGFDPSRQVPKLRGVDLFCGGGNFGRGLEEGGAIEMQWHQLHPFAGSIDDLQRLALEGKFSDKVPKIGTVDFVSAGSPCPGFSRLTVDKATPEQRKNQSLVAAFASFIDTYRPRYGLLENVLEIVQPRREKNEDVFCQLICALVGLGYQTHFFLLDAWSYGSPQSRSRVFLCFAAPGHKLPEPPLQSHSHYKPDVRLKTLGKLPNDEPMGEHLVMPTPFRFIGSEEATADLPNIIDGKFDICIPFPDHRLAHGYTKYLRNQLSVIPTHPYGMNFTTTWNKGHGIMTKAERDFFPAAGRRVTQASSRAWSRCFPQQVMQTVTTVPSPADARMGRILHWNQSRTLTVMEARRAQGFLDHEVILGQPKDQWRVVVNSVAKEVSLALGLSFREAWIGSLVDEDEADPTLGQQSILNDMNIAQLNTPPGPSSRSTPSAGADALGSSRPPKRSLESTLEVQLFVSKMAKTIADSE